MKRSLKFSLKFANTHKKIQLDFLHSEYGRFVNLLLGALFNKQELSEKFIKSIDSSLSYRYRQCAKRQSFKIFKSWCRSKKKNNKPVFKGSMVLDERFFDIQTSKRSFDYWIKLSTLNKGKRISIPFKSYDFANHYFQKWKLVKGGKLTKNKKGWFLILTFKKENIPPKKDGRIIGVDIGIKKLMVDSGGNFYGYKIESLMEKINRKVQGSNAFKRALKERDYYVNATAKELFSVATKMIFIEDIKNIKKNIKKEKRLSKGFRSKFQRWTYSKLLSRIEQLCEVGGVHCHRIDPAYTSQTCSKCGDVHKQNRNGEIFKCVNCGHTLDADLNASLNILNLGLAQQAMVAGRMKAGFYGIS